MIALHCFFRRQTRLQRLAGSLLLVENLRRSTSNDSNPTDDLERQSDLFGSRTCNFTYDSFVTGPTTSTATSNIKCQEKGATSGRTTVTSLLSKPGSRVLRDGQSLIGTAQPFLDSNVLLSLALRRAAARHMMAMRPRSNKLVGVYQW